MGGKRLTGAVEARKRRAIEATNCKSLAYLRGELNIPLKRKGRVTVNDVTGRE